jgi:hypothetical protein
MDSYTFMHEVKENSWELVTTNLQGIGSVSL